MQAENLFITVPEVTLPNGIVVPSFQVGQYACGKGKKGAAIVTADSLPWTKIDFNKAKAACKISGFELITELQWLAIAHDVANQDCNWTGGKVGEGDLFQGLRNSRIRNFQPGNYVSADPTEQRWLTLSNGERICDLNGYVCQWVFDNVQGDENGIIARAFASDSPSITTAHFPSEEKGMGLFFGAIDIRLQPDKCNWTGHALIRSGTKDHGVSAGVFTIGLCLPQTRAPGLGFRCTKPIMKG